VCESDGLPYSLFFYISPYKRSKQTCAAVAAQFERSQIIGVREEPQLREQDFGSAHPRAARAACAARCRAAVRDARVRRSAALADFQDSTALQRDKAERNAYGRFFYRFPNGESGSDVYDRLTVFEDHMVRDIDTGRFPEGTHLVVVTHGLALRIFLARWFHWTTEEYESVYNPPNCTPLIMERSAAQEEAAEVCYLDGSACDPGGRNHTKNLYRLTPASLALLQCDDPAMGEMMTPEDEWRRTLGKASAGWRDDDDEQCLVPPVDYATEGEE
jgi:broad specificity phosphatase PhoE